MIDNSLRPRIKGTTDGQFGARIPALWIGEGGFNHITCALGSNANYHFNIDESDQKYNTGNWVNVKLSQINGVYEYKINGNVLHTAVNSNPQTWNNVKVVIGNTYDHVACKHAVVGEYRKFQIHSRPG